MIRGVLRKTKTPKQTFPSLTWHRWQLPESNIVRRIKGLKDKSHYAPSCHPDNNFKISNLNNKISIFNFNFKLEIGSTIHYNWEHARSGVNLQIYREEFGRTLILEFVRYIRFFYIFSSLNQTSDQLKVGIVDDKTISSLRRGEFGKRKKENNLR